jgi:CubicO group peptidase (beta-lactamase class C family)
MNQFFAFFICVFLCGYSVHADRLHDILPEFEAYVEKVKQTWGAPGVAIAIVKGDETYIKAFGEREVSTGKKIDTNTVFQIASLTKNFLAHLFARLVQDGKVNWDDPVIKYMPQFFIGNDDITKQFTIRDLLSHRSGLPSFSGDTFWYIGFSQDEMISGLSKLPLKNTPRAKYGYQNHLVGIASLVAEKITGKTIEVLFKEYLFTPLGITSGGASLEAVSPKHSFFERFLGSSKDLNVAYAHDDRGGVTHKLPFSSLIYLFPGTSGASMSISDYAKWLRFLVNKCAVNNVPLIAPMHSKELITPHIACEMKPDDNQFPGDRYTKIAYGMGHFLYTYGEGDKKVNGYGHMGAFYGTRSLMMVVPEEKLGIAIFSNYGSFRVSFLPEALINKFMDLYLNLSPIDWNMRIKNDFDKVKRINKQFYEAERLQNPKPARKLANYVGRFRNDVYGELSLVVESNKLHLLYRDKKIPLQHYNANQFSFPAHLLSDSFGNSDIGRIEFGSTTGRGLDICSLWTLLREGKDEGLFRRVE